MKKRMVLRLLSCCLAGILLVETPVQVAAAPSDVLDTGEISDARDMDEDEFLETEMDFAESKEEAAEEKESKAEEASGAEESESQDETENKESAETEDIGQEGDSGTQESSEQEENSGTGEELASEQDSEKKDELKTEEEAKTEEETKEEAETEEPVQADESEREEKSDRLTLTGLQYGIRPEYSDDFDPDTSADALSDLANALADGDATISEYAISPDTLKNMLTWLVVHEEEYYTLLPYVEYTYVEKENSQEVRTVSVSWLSPDKLLSLSPVYGEQDVKISFTGAEGIELYKLFQISENGIREFSAEDGQEIIIDRTEAEDPAAYQYVVCGYQTVEDALKLCAFSKCTSAEYEPISTEVLATESPKDAGVIQLGKPVLQYAVSKNTVTLTWKAVEDADGYILYEVVNGQYKQIDRVEDRVSKELSHVIPDMKFNESHKYAVSAYVNNNDAEQTYTEGEKSNTVEVEIGFEEIQLTASVVSCKEISLTWTQSFGADGYEIQRSGLTDKIRIQSGSKTTYKDTVQPNTTYTYQIRPYQIRERDTTGQPVQYSYGNWSNKASAKPVLSKVSGVSVKALDYKTLKITWNQVEGAAGYQVYRSTSKTGTYTKIATLTSRKKTSYQDTGRKPGVTCYYKIRPYCVVNGKTIEGVDSLIKSGTTKMGQVTGVKTEPLSYTSVKISWSKVDGASGYNVYYSTSKDSGYKVLKTTSSASYKHTGLTTGETYYYKIRVYKTVDGKKVNGDYSKIIKAKVTLPAVVLAEKSATTYNSVTLSWKKVTGASGYIVYRSESKNGTWTKLKMIQSGSTKSYKDNKVVSGKTYYYKVRAYRTVKGKKVYGAYSEAIKAKPMLKTPSLKKTTITYNSVTLSWKKITGASGYQIYRSTSKDGTYTKVKNISSASTVSYKDSGLNAGTTYYYKIRAYRTVSGKKGYSAYSNLVDVLPTLDKVSGFKAIPTGSDEKGSIQLTWSKVDGAAGYAIERSTEKEGTYKTVKVIDSGSTLSFTNSDLTFGETYYYRISATKGDYKGPAAGPVSAMAIAVSLSDSSLTLSVGDTDKLAAATIPKGKITWISSDTDVVTVDSNGKVTAVGGGIAKINIKVDDVMILKCVNVTVKGGIKGAYKGIDVSSYQGTIDWKKVAEDGIDFAMIRGITGSSSSTTKDTCFEENYKGATANGIKVGVYRYSYAISRTKAKAEANAIIEALNGRKLDYPIVMDMEDKSILEDTGSNARRSEIILAFKKEVEAAGYHFALYANTTWLNNYLDMDMLKDVDIWIARWTDLEKGHGYNGKGNVTMWQYSSSGRVDGIKGNVDLNVSYKKY